MADIVTIQKYLVESDLKHHKLKHCKEIEVSGDLVSSKRVVNKQRSLQEQGV